MVQTSHPRESGTKSAVQNKTSTKLGGHYKKDVAALRGEERYSLEAAGNKTLYQDFVSSINESYNGAWNFGFYVYLLSMVTLCTLALLHSFVHTEEHCLKSP